MSGNLSSDDWFSCRKNNYLWPVTRWHHWIFLLLLLQTCLRLVLALHLCPRVLVLSSEGALGSVLYVLRFINSQCSTALISFLCFNSLGMKNRHDFFRAAVYNPMINAFLKSTKLLLAGAWACTYSQLVCVVFQRIYVTSLFPGQIFMVPAFFVLLLWKLLR